MPQPEGAELIAADVASLVLVRRAHKRTAWAFTQRAHGAPPLATMAEPLRKFESVGRIAGADPESFWWWLQDEALDHIGRELASKNYCVIDGLLGPHALRALRDEVAALRDTGRLQPSKLAGGRTGGMLTYTHTAVRGDHVAWFDGDEGEATWPSRTLSRYLQKVDTLVAQLAEHAGEQLRSIASRSKAMVTCYPGGGARYVRHCDNSCDSGHGDRCNGRRLTAILYLNERWGPLHGGELRVHPPFAPKGQPPLCDVAPLGDRLILFYADCAQRTHTRIRSRAHTRIRRTPPAAHRSRIRRPGLALSWQLARAPALIRRPSTTPVPARPKPLRLSIHAWRGVA
jgi:Rps23 Pro-64 3,4-dihydroxylase Tpa1-like proline 4-hydroxylase